MKDLFQLCVQITFTGLFDQSLVVEEVVIVYKIKHNKYFMSYCETRAMSKIFCVSASCLLLPYTLDWLVRFSTFINLYVFKLFIWMVSKMDRCFVINLSRPKQLVS